MNPVSVALTVAWLDAFRRLAVAKTLLDEVQLPQDKSLTDAIEGALRSTAETAEHMIRIEAEGRALDILA